VSVVSGGLSLSEFAEVAGTVFGGIAVVFAGSAGRYRSLRSRVRAAEEAARREAEKRVMLTVIVERGFTGANSTLEFTGGLIHRLYEGRAESSQSAEVMEALSQLRADLERSAAEARVMSEEETSQVSALQQLINRFGNVGTAELLRRGAELGQIGTVTPETLREASDQIVKRTSEESRATRISRKTKRKPRRDEPLP
jgi:hypothetical protein